MSDRGDLVIADCAKCKASMPREQRQALGCGYEPRSDRIHLTMWTPPSGSAGYQGPPPTTCVGYTSILPEVRETMLAGFYAEKGNLSVWLQGQIATDEMLHAIVIHTAARNGVRTWAMTPQADGGGGA